LALNVGANTIDVRVTAQNGTTIKTYTTVVTRTGSTNANLANMVISSGTLSPVFATATTEYTTTVTNATTNITVTPTKSDANATIAVQVNGAGFSTVASGTASSALALNIGTNSIDVQVTAQDGTTVKTYTITVTRIGSNNADLSSMSISSGTLSPVFVSSTTSYTANVSNTISSVTVTPTRSEANATIQVRVNGGTYTTVNSGSASDPLVLNVGTNTIDVLVRAQDGSTIKTYTTTISRATSSNADLSSLSISSGVLSPAFVSSTTFYASGVSNATTSITVTPTKSEANSTIRIRVNGGTYTTVASGSASSSLSLNVGTNLIEVQVTAQDGITVKTYTVSVIRSGVGSNNADLSAMSISSGTLSPAFVNSTTSYTASVTNATTSITITPTKSEANATIPVRVNGGVYTTVASGSASSSLSLNVGTNLIEVQVTAQDGTTVKTYSISVIRSGVGSNNADLSAMSISSGTISPAFVSSTTSYTASVTNATTSITVTPTKSDANATIQVRVNGGVYTTVASGSASSSLSLNVGTNLIEVQVTAQDGTTVKTYTTTVTRIGSNNADLSGLVIFFGTLSPVFTASTTNYTVSVNNEVSVNRVTPTAAQANATIEVQVNSGGYAAVTSGSVSGLLPLNVGANTIQVRVTAQDGTTLKTYTVIVNRAAAISNNANLSAMSISNGILSPSFETGTTSYTAVVTNAITSVTVTPTAAEANATIQVSVNNGTYATVTSGTSSSPLSLNLGVNTIDVQVTAQDGTTIVVYTTSITRGFAGSSNADLSAMSLSSGVLSPGFSSGNTAFTATVSNAVSNITLTPTVAQANASISVQINDGGYTPVISANTSDALALNIGVNKIDVQVTAQDGITQKIYTTLVTRLGSGTNNADLASLSISSGTLSPVFAITTTSYTTSVTSATTSVTVTPTTSEPNATVQVRINGGSYATVTSGSPSSVLSLNVGSNTIDVKVTAQDGTTIKTYTITVERPMMPPGNALHLDGINDYASVSSTRNIPLANSNYTIEAWIKPDAMGAKGIVGWGAFGASNQVNAFKLGTNQLVNYWWGNDLTVTVGDITGKWHHVACTYDGTTRKIYLDGVVVGSDAPIGHNVTSTANFRIGSTNNGEYFGGSIDEVRIWNIARTQSQIQANMLSIISGSTAGLVAYYNFDNGIAGGSNTGVTTLDDQTANANTGTLNNFALTGSTSNWISSTAWNTWLGTTSNSYAIATNWQLGTVPTTADNIVIPTGAANLPVSITGTQAVNILGIQSSASATVTGTLKVAAQVYNSGILTATSGTIELNGINAQTIASSTFAGNTVQNLTINNAAGVTLGGTLNVTGVYTPTSGVLSAGGYLTFKSSATGTARIAAGTGSYITGNVIVERYIPAGKRSFRFLTPTVTTTNFIKANWQEGANNTSLLYSSNQNPVANYGTHITGSITGLNGFDATLTGNASMFQFNNTTQAWNTGIANTNATNLIAGNAYRILVRGDRTIDLSTQPATSTATTLRATGALITGAVSFGTASSSPSSLPTLAANASEYSFIGNPYASPIDWNALTKTGLTGYYYIWDPTLATRGAYVSCFTDGTKSNGSSNITTAIQSGQAFFVQNTSGASARQLDIAEANKTTGNTNVFRTQSGTSTLSLQLYLTANTNGTSQDGATVLFNNNYSNTVNDDDATKFTNQDENIAVQRGASLMSIERRDTPVPTDTVQLKTWQLTQNNYTFRIAASNFDGSVNAYLQDNYLNNETLLNLNGTTDVNFTTTSTAATTATDRFRIVFRINNNLPVTITNLKAYQKNAGIEVAWATQNELNLQSYEVEKSTDATYFTKAGTVQATGVTNYNWLDVNPNNGNNFYRLKAIDKNGDYKYTQVVNVKIGVIKNVFTVVGNPVKGKIIMLQLENVDKGNYTLKVINNIGQTIASKTITHNGGSATEMISLGNVAQGSYQLSIIGNNVKETRTIIVE
jgi:hypothetical protein